jgi:exopolysaccharide biosynthesis polyprenyl glycosylphosphotransferase
MSQRYSKYSPFFVLILDIIILNITLIINYYYFQIPNSFNSLFFQVLSIFNLAWVGITLLTRNNIFSRPLKQWESIQTILSSALTHFILVLGVLYLVQQYELTRIFFVAQFISFSLLLVFQRLAIINAVNYIRAKGYNRRKIWLIGDLEVIKRVEGSFNNHPEYGYNLIKPLYKQLSEYSKHEIKQFITFNEIDEVFICFKEIQKDFITDALEFEKMGVKIKMISDLQIDGANAQLLAYDNFPVIYISSTPFEDWRVKFIKRAFDLIISSSIMILGFPVFLLLVIITKLSSKGSVFYKQERIGKNGTPFYIFKFRSMCLDAECNGPQLAKENDPRVTNWGRIMRNTKLDELPQFLNVFLGQMSIVGPRPERRFFIEKIIEKAPQYKKLLAIKPGITSIGQIRYGYAENVDQMIQRMKFDQFYLKNQRMALDLSIIMATIRIMVQGKGK